MKKITKEEAEQIAVLEGRSSKVRTAVLHMKVGEILQIDRSDWKPINGPQQMCVRVTERTKMEFKVQTMASRTGWLIERVK
jgi:hypothetical protein